MDTGPQPDPLRAARLAFLGALGLAAALCLWRLGEGSLHEFDEGLTAERSREMALAGDFSIPSFQFRPDFRKPPLYYAFAAAAARLLGWSELAVRLGSALCGLGCVALAGVLARRLSGDPWSAPAAALLLALNPHWMNWTRVGHLDSALLLGALGGAALLLGPAGPSRALAAGAVFAFGALAKNPLAVAGLLIPAVAAARARRPFARTAGLALLAFAVLGLGWYAAAAARWGRPFVDSFLSYNALARATRAIEGHTGGPGFYVFGAARAAPAPYAAAVALVAWAAGRDRAALGRALPGLLPLLLALAALSAAGSKREIYLLAVHPLAAVAGGTLAAAAARRASARAARPGAAVLALALALGFARDFVPALDGAPDLKRAGEWLAAEAAPGDVVLCRGVAPQLPLFYGRLARPAIENRPPAEAFAELRRRGGHAVFVVAPRRRTERLLEEVRAAAGPGVPVELALRTRAVVVVRARAAAPRGLASGPPA